jgi:hypothetical protein
MILYSCIWKTISDPINPATKYVVFRASSMLLIKAPAIEAELSPSPPLAL